MIIFKKVEIEGFGSIVKPLVFTLDLEGLNVLRGRVGSGKTTVPSAMSWALYGQSLKEKSQITTWEEIRDKEFRGTKVAVTFEKNGDIYQIIRCEKYKGKVGKSKGGSRIIINVNGVDSIEIDNPIFKGVKGKREQQALIEKILGYSFDLFKSSIVFGQKMKRIIEETGPKKKKIFDEAFDAGFIDEARENEKNELAKLKGLLDKEEDKLDNLSEKIIDKRDSYKEALKFEKNFLKEKKKNIKEIGDEIGSIEKELEKIPTKEVKKKTSKIKSKLEKARKEKNDLYKTKVKKEGLEKEIRKLINEAKEKREQTKVKNKVCPTCGGKLNKEKGIELVKQYKKELKHLKQTIGDKQGELNKLKEVDLKNINAEISKLEKKYDKAYDRERNNVFLLSQKPKLLAKLDRLVEKRSLLEQEELTIHSNRYKKQIKKLELTLKRHKKRRKQLGKSISIKKWLISDPLSNSGIKAYIFDNLLGSVNERLEQYSKVLGFKVEFGIDLETHNKDFYQAILYDDIIIPYQDLSGGQKQLVDTSIAFAIHDVISEIRPSNLMFMDEPFEGLGDEEIELVEELIETKAKGKSLFLITHHKSFNPRNANEIIFRITKNKTTEII